MLPVYSLLLLLLLLTTTQAKNNLKNVILPGGGSERVLFFYPPGFNDDLDLPICSSVSAACSVVHRRFWMPTIAERLCKCPLGSVCSPVWDDNDNKHILINNRSQIKLCSSVEVFPTCTGENIEEISVHSITSPDYTDTPISRRTQTLIKSLTVTCYCPIAHGDTHRYWLHTHNITHTDGTITQYYKCHKLSYCSSYEFCGNIRADTFSSYYRCYCPPQHLCTAQNFTTSTAQEISYYGPTYSGVCLPQHTEL